MMRAGFVLLSLLLGSTAAANTGGIAGYSGKGGQTCAACHQAIPAQIMTTISGPLFVQPGQKVTYTVSTGGYMYAGTRDGFGMAASSGALSVNAAETTRTKLLQGEVVHSQPGAPAAGSYRTQWKVDWTAPSATGYHTLYAAGVLGAGSTTDMTDLTSHGSLSVRVGICKSNGECDDGNPCTTDSCMSALSKCLNVPKQGCCQTSADCNDGNPCTAESCLATKLCASATVAGCCTKDADCADTNVCTKDVCDLLKHTCGHAAILGCCVPGGTPCNDGSACTIDVCDTMTSKCAFTPKTGCCTKNTDCADANPCTTETCNVATGVCSTSPTVGCCQTDAQCEDSNPCTADSCKANACAHDKLIGCCTKDADCPDGNPCTADKCLFGACQYSPIDCPAPDAGPVVTDGPKPKGDGGPAADAKPAAGDPTPTIPPKNDDGCSFVPGSRTGALALFSLGLLLLLSLRRRRD